MDWFSVAMGHVPSEHPKTPQKAFERPQKSGLLIPSKVPEVGFDPCVQLGYSVMYE